MDYLTREQAIAKTNQALVCVHYHIPSGVADDNADDISAIAWDDYIVGYSIG